MKPLVFALLALATTLDARHALIPKPLSLRAEQASSFRLGPETRISYSGLDSAATAGLLALSLRPATGLPLTLVRSGSAGVGNIHLQLGEVPGTAGREAYQLATRKRGVVLTGRSLAGLINGSQTLRQLLAPEIYHSTKHAAPAWRIDPLTIIDEPADPWRGMMLDVSRYFFSKPDTSSAFPPQRLSPNACPMAAWVFPVKARSTAAACATPSMTPSPALTPEFCPHRLPPRNTSPSRPSPAPPMVIAASPEPLATK